jgi:hypothetical protein
MTDDEPGRESRSARRNRRYRAACCGGTLLSVLLHFFVFLLWPGATVPLMSLGGSDVDPAFQRPDPVRVVRLAAADQTSPATTVPTLTRVWPTVAVRQMAASPRALDLTPARSLDGRRGAAPQLRHSTPGPLVLEADRYVQPIALGILPDWKPRWSLHGVVVTARVHLDAAGRPTGLVELVPPTQSQRVNREIVSRVRTLEYQPASRNGDSVAAWAEITFVFCGESVKATSPAPPKIPEAPCAAVPADASVGDTDAEEILVIDADGSNLRRITTNQWMDAQPDW